MSDPLITPPGPRHASRNIVPLANAFIRRYVRLRTSDDALVLALYAIATHVGVAFDAFPYLAITSETKQSGKTRLAEVLAFLCLNSRMFTAMTDAVLFQTIRHGDVTLFIDEQELLSANSASQRRAILNVGYRRGQTVPRAKSGGGVVEWNVYCPKVFILIGDMTDTLRDRSITVRLVRGTPPHRWQWDEARKIGDAIRALIASSVEFWRDEILMTYANLPRLSWLPDRDEELWRPLFAVASVVCPELVPVLEHAAADFSAEKTIPARRHVDLHGADDAARDDALARQLLGDLYAVMPGSQMTTADALLALKALSRAPWRRLHGTGLTAADMSNLLARFEGVKPRVLRIATRQSKKSKSTARGYKRADVFAAVERLAQPHDIDDASDDWVAGLLDHSHDD